MPIQRTTDTCLLGCWMKERATFAEENRRLCIVVEREIKALRCNKTMMVLQCGDPLTSHKHVDGVDGRRQ